MTASRWTRRQMLAGMGVGAGAAALSGCDRGRSLVRFDHGVASGDPLADRVVLWTRVSPVEPAPQTIPVRWEVAADSAFDQVVAEGQTATDAARDFTVKVDAGGLAPGQRYHYRFSVAGDKSPVGRTRTLPSGPVDRVAFAVVSCSNYSHGLFTVYRAIAAREDIDAVLHLGDYLYEYPPDVYVSEPAIAMGRVVVPDGELLTLADYRTRYALYRTDADLQAAHAAHPFIAVWDDHEVANDAWKGGAENHDDSEGDFATRKAAAIRAYHEWLPIRETPDGDPGRLYRSFDFGDLASLIMLDTRLAGRDRQIDYQRDMIYRSAPFDFSDPERPRAVTNARRAARLSAEVRRDIPIPFDMTGPEPRPILDYQRIATLDPANLPDGIAFLPDVDRFRADLLERPDRSILGTEQEAWLRDRLAASKARGVPWQMVGQQLLVGKLVAPDLADQGDPEQLAALPRETLDRLALLARLGLPLNLDAWDGYGAARDRFFADVRAHANNVVVLSGDSHNAWAFNLTDSQDGQPVAVELATPSVSSPGLERYLAVDPDVLAQAFVARNRELVYLNSHQRGFLTVAITPEAVSADWHFLKDVFDPDGQPRPGHSMQVAIDGHQLSEA